MPITPVFIQLPDWPAPDMPTVVDADGQVADDKVYADLDPVTGLLTIGPLYARTGMEDNGRDEAEQVLARVAMNDLMGIVLGHERDEHDGEPCEDERIGMLAYFMHCMGVNRERLPRIMDAIATYEEHHHDHDHSHGPGHDH
jgi:hypothetical protein